MLIKPQNRKIIRIGNSQGITIPPWILYGLDLAIGDTVAVTFRRVSGGLDDKTKKGKI